MDIFPFSFLRKGGEIDASISFLHYDREGFIILDAIEKVLDARKSMTKSWFFESKVKVKEMKTSFINLP